MPLPESLVLAPTPKQNVFRSPSGQLLSPPPDWTHLPPGDPGLTRRVKAAGPSWTVQEKVGRKMFSKGVWAPTATIAKVRADLEAERSTPQYARKQAAAAQRRDREQTAYVEDFGAAVRDFLSFHPRYADLGARLTAAVTLHATPVGSGTVARTERIPLEERAEAAVIAWLRHQTTAYDHMTIARVKGKRREVRRMLAERSRALLNNYRAGADMNPATCPLQKALNAPKPP